MRIAGRRSASDAYDVAIAAFDVVLDRARDARVRALRAGTPDGIRAVRNAVVPLWTELECIATRWMRTSSEPPGRVEAYRAFYANQLATIERELRGVESAAEADATEVRRRAVRQTPTKVAAAS